MRRRMPTLIATLAVIGMFPVLAAAQSGPPAPMPVPPAAGQPAEPGSPEAGGQPPPGVRSNGPAPRRGEGAGGADEAPQQGRGGCRYVPGKLDLIV